MARYELIERIGVGGMAEIFRGRAVAGGGFEKPVAIKRILPHLSQDKRFVELLIAEAKTLSQLRHRNVVQIYDVGLGDDGQYFLVMEYVDGVDLGALARSFRDAGLTLPLDVALHIAGEICEALEHAHVARGEDGAPLGLVHRDVSPSNVLLSRAGEVKLTDFGIAKRTEEATGHGGVRGKFAYISPEQAVNAHVDARSDVYSLGVLLFELTLGEPLYSHLPDFDALRAVRDAKPPRTAARGDVDPGLARILDTALAPRPDDRYPSAGTLGATIRSFRYALASSGGDPAAEIARLVVAQREGRIPVAPTLEPPEPTVVRILTAAGFGAARTGESEAAGHDLGELFDDEQTRAVGRPGVAARLRPPSTPSPDERGVTDGGERTRRVLPPAGLASLGGTPRPAPHPVAPPPARPVGTLDPPVGERPGASFAPPARFTPTPEGGAREPWSSPNASSLRSPTATTRDVFDRPPPVAPRRPHELPWRDAGWLGGSRRRTILIAGGACVACALVAFVVVGSLLGGDHPLLTPPPRVAVPRSTVVDAGRSITPSSPKAPSVKAPARPAAAAKPRPSRPAPKRTTERPRPTARPSASAKKKRPTKSTKKRPASGKN